MEPTKNNNQATAVSETGTIVLVSGREEMRDHVEQLVCDSGWTVRVVGDCSALLAILDGLALASVILLDREACATGWQASIDAVSRRRPEIGILLLIDDDEDPYPFIAAGAAGTLPMGAGRQQVRAQLLRVIRERDLMARFRAEVQQHRKAEQEVRRGFRLQSLLNRLLRLGLEAGSLDEIYDSFLSIITSLPWLELKPKGALFRVEDDGLVMVAQRDLAPSLLTMCDRVPFGRCLCGRAAADGRIVFADSVDERHDHRYEGIAPHGHYCVPVRGEEQELLGVFTVYTGAGTPYNHFVAEILKSAAAALGSLIGMFRAKQSLSASEEKYRAITETVSDAIVMMDGDGRIVFWNPAAERTFGFPAAEVLGRDLHEMLCPQAQIATAQGGLAHFRETGDGPLLGQTVIVSACHRDGHEFPVELSLSALRMADAWHAVAVVRDISQRLAQERERKKLQSQLRHAQKMEAIGTLAGGIAHDFNNILTSILGFAQLVREECRENEQAVKDIAQVINAGNRAKELVRQILTFSRQQERDCEPVQVSLIVKEAVKLLRASIPPTITIDTAIRGSDGVVMADPTRIHQVMMNLCTNAYQAMQHGGTLSVALEQQTLDQQLIGAAGPIAAGNYLVLTVSDTGCGIAADVMTRIFEPYFTTKSAEDGTGLGLATVYGIVKDIGGNITVQSTVGEGTTFKVYLPTVELVRASVQAEVQQELAGSERILLVDDEQAIVELTRRGLTRLGYEVTGRTSAVEAAELFRARPDDFDLLITDYAMPNMDGIALAAELQALRPQLPVLLVTGFDRGLEDEVLERAGVAACLQKPVVFKELAREIRQLFGPEKRLVAGNT